MRYRSATEITEHIDNAKLFYCYNVMVQNINKNAKFWSKDTGIASLKRLAASTHRPVVRDN